MGRPSKTKRTEFGERLLAARKQRGLSQSQVAEKLGITQPSYAAWERRETSLKPDHLTTLAALLDVPVDSLLGNATARQRSGGPIGKVRRLFESVSQLPRSQQEKVIAILEPFVAQHREKAS